MSNFRVGDYIKTRCESSLLDFSRFFNVQVSKQKYIVGRPHIKIAEALDRVVNGECTRLIINVAPRFGKTQLAVKNFIAYSFIRNPASQFIHLSYSDELVNKNSKGIQEIMRTNAYRLLFPDVCLSRAISGSIETTAGGCLYCASTGGQVTGFGAGIIDPTGDAGFGGAIIIDDPIKPDDALSITQREKVNDRFESVIRNRVNSKKTPIIIIMQRVHEHDLCGYLIEREGEKKNGGEWEVLTLPALYYDDEMQMHSLWEYKYTVEELLKLRKINSWNFDTQYLQNPKPIEGLLFPESTTRYYKDEPEEPDFIYMQCDPADEGTNKTCSAVYKVKGEDVYVSDVIYTEKPSEVVIPEIIMQMKMNNVRQARVESNSAWSLYRKEIKRQAAESGLGVEIISVKQRDNKEVRIFNQAPTIQRRFVYRHPSIQNAAYKVYMADKHSYLKLVKDQKDDGVDTDTAACEYLKRLGMIPTI